MRFIADLHIHSKYSRATSKEMVLEEIDRWADDKGILVMGTGDFTHPVWFKEIKEKLEPAEAGLFKLKSQYKKKTLKGNLSETRFLLTSEISSIYSKVSAETGEKNVHRIHNLVFAPDIETIESIITQLSLIGNLKSDGRPILGLDAEELARIVFNVNPEAVIIPAHAWTPWFSVFGSMSGFDSLEECFGKQAKHIFAIETGLSSDPAMNWRLSKLDNISFISNSDCHSLQKIGREANIFDTELSYSGIIDAIRNGIPNQHKSAQNQHKSAFIATIEFFPEEGKYHYDGHRNCDVVFAPEETKKHKNICPKCGKKLTVGVMNRVDELADRGVDYKDDKRVPYYSLIPLDEIIAESFGLVGTKTKKVVEEYNNLIKSLGSELKILLEVNEEEIKLFADPRVAEGIKRVRNGQVKIHPGFDGEYGKIKIFGEKEREKLES
ncbi:MAG TPA: DNA helicase UvrD [Candidatus Wolfebacteria bacterium]|nr:DNA helicase UvrD [Candidatus Wolfebacteria bacterium]